MIIILCEGTTDAILIGYFLTKYNYAYSKEKDSPVKIPTPKRNEEINWYKKTDSDPWIAIWTVGGFDRLGNGLFKILSRNQIERNKSRRFTRIILFCDRDQRSEQEFQDLAASWEKPPEFECEKMAATGSWSKYKMTSINRTPAEEMSGELLFVAIPPDAKGNLETFLLEALANENENDRHIVEMSKKYINEIPDTPYLTKNRFREKAQLGVALSTFSPDWVFSETDKRLTNVDWKNVSDVNSVFHFFDDIIPANK